METRVGGGRTIALEKERGVSGGGGCNRKGKRGREGEKKKEKVKDLNTCMLINQGGGTSSEVIPKASFKSLDMTPGEEGRGNGVRKILLLLLFSFFLEGGRLFLLLSLLMLSLPGVFCLT